MNYRKEILIACLALAFFFSVAYDTLIVISVGDSLRAVLALAVMGSLAAALVMAKYPRSLIQPALVAAWPLHVYTVALLINVYCFQDGAHLRSLLAYTFVAYAAFLVLPLYLHLDRSVFDVFVKIIAFGSAILAIPAMIGSMGIEFIMGMPIRNKYGYAEFSGLIASSGVLEHPEGLALQMAIGMFCSIYAWRKTRNWWYMACSILVIAGLTISQGRGAIFGVFIAIVFCLLPELFRRSRPVFITSLALCLLFPFAIWPQLAAIPGVADYLRLERGLSGRDIAWGYAISLVEEKPLVGHGFESSADLSEEGRSYLQRSGYSGVGTTFHNTFITKAVEFGVIVTALYTLMYLVPLIRVCGTDDDPFVDDLLRSIVIVAITASVFRDYNIGGIRSTTLLTATFLGLANLRILFARSESPIPQQAVAETLARPAIPLRETPV